MVAVGYESDALVVGVRVDPNRLLAGLVNIDGQVVPLRAGSSSYGTVGSLRARTLTDSSVETVIGEVASLVRDLIGAEDGLVQGLGVQLGGHVDRREGIVTLSPQMAWRAPVRLAERLRRATGLETVVENDVKSLATALHHKMDIDGRPPIDARRGFAVVNVSRGIGAALMVGSQLIRGASGMAGELGHLTLDPDGEALCACGSHGCLQSLAGSEAVVRAMRALGRPHISDVRAAAELASSGDTAAWSAFDEAGRVLGRGIAMLLNLFNPALVILCGESAMLECEPYRRAIDEAMIRYAYSTAAKDCKIEYKARTDDLAVFGAASAFWDHVSGVEDE